MVEVAMEFGTVENNRSTEVVRWESFLPRSQLRVLLVESDDSTRQIITALLRKCNYRVTAVPNGLLAWEILKGQPHDIDLILTEVELPSVSEFALLTLIMEHDFCKNIPVIMISSQDSVNVVLKCMLKGAADFLIKPVRKNELRNLWQHVWRKHMLANGYAPQRLPAPSYKGESTAESSRSCDFASSSQKMKEGSDTQSSCETHLEAERTYVQNLQGLSQQKCTIIPFGNVCIEQQINGTKLNEKSPPTENQTKGKSNMLGVEIAHFHEASQPNASELGDEFPVVKAQSQNEGRGLGDNMEISKAVTEAHHYIDEPLEPFARVIDLIGSFDNQPKSTELSRLNNIKSMSEVAPQLELSLTRSSDRHPLKHSDLSAFSRYTNTKTQPLFPSLAGIFIELMEDARKSEITCQAQAADGGSEEFKLTSRSLQVGVIATPDIISDKGVDKCGHAFTSMVHMQSDSPPWSSPKAGEQREHSSVSASLSAHSIPDIHDLEQAYCQSDGTANCSIDHTISRQKSQDSVGEPKCGSPADQTTSSSLYNGTLNHENSITYGGISSRSDASFHGNITATENVKEMGSLRSSQREAALTKFRLKRKERCFDKKIRYQSRQRLAEQRPRVKGQFIRHQVVQIVNC